MATKRNSESERAPNFSSTDVEMLINLVKKYRTILECKKSDAVTWKEKNTAWESISKEFHDLTGISRSAKTFREKYKNLKTESKKKFAEEKCQTFKTGGGKWVPVEISDIDEQLKELCGMSVTGLNNTFDSDSYVPIPSSSPDFEKIYIEIEEEDNITENGPCNKPEIIENSETQIDQRETHEHLTNRSWKSWNPTMLKSPKSLVLNGSDVIVKKDHFCTDPDRPNRKRKTVLTEDCRIKINTLSAAKLELTKLQIQCTKEENERKQQEHDLRMSNLKEESQHERDLNSIIIKQKQLELELMKMKLKKFNV